MNRLLDMEPNISELYEVPTFPCNDKYLSINQTQSVGAPSSPPNISIYTLNTSSYEISVNLSSCSISPCHLYTIDGVPDGWIDGWTCDPANHPGQPYGKYLIPDYEFQFGEGEDKNLNGAFDAGETSPALIDSDAYRNAPCYIPGTPP